MIISLQPRLPPLHILKLGIILIILHQLLPVIRLATPCQRIHQNSNNLLLTDLYERAVIHVGSFFIAETGEERPDFAEGRAM